MPDRSRLVDVTPEQLTSRLLQLRADHACWMRVANKWGTLRALQEEIDHYQWLLTGGSDAEPVEPSAGKTNYQSGASDG